MRQAIYRNNAKKDILTVGELRGQHLPHKRFGNHCGAPSGALFKHP
jgi:hypothetical protein